MGRKVILTTDTILLCKHCGQWTLGPAGAVRHGNVSHNLGLSLKDEKGILREFDHRKKVPNEIRDELLTRRDTAARYRSKRKRKNAELSIKSLTSDPAPAPAPLAEPLPEPTPKPELQHVLPDPNVSPDVQLVDGGIVVSLPVVLTFKIPVGTPLLLPANL